MSDPVDGQYLLMSTEDGGADWLQNLSDPRSAPHAKEGEAAFAASGTCLITLGAHDAFVVSGGSDARVFRSEDRGLAWKIASTAITKGTPGSGIFSIAMADAKNGVIVGGNYEKPDEHKNNLAFTTDGGQTWKLGVGLNGYRSGVTYVDENTIIAVGTNGSDMSADGGKTWNKIGSENLNAVQARGKKGVWAVGPKGMVAKMK